MKLNEYLEIFNDETLLELYCKENGFVFTEEVMCSVCGHKMYKERKARRRSFRYKCSFIKSENGIRKRLCNKTISEKSIFILEKLNISKKKFS